MVHADTKLAEELEADADAYPDERPEVLLEAAGGWQRAGYPDRARAILDDLIRSGANTRVTPASNSPTCIWRRVTPNRRTPS